MHQMNGTTMQNSRYIVFLRVLACGREMASYILHSVSNSAMNAKRISIQYIYSKSEIPQVDAKAATRFDHAPALGTPSAEHLELERE
jgi:hypothetical protein